MGTITLPTLHDSHICTNSYGNYYNTCWGWQSTLFINDGYERLTLIRPDFSTLPANATITSVYMSIYCFTNSTDFTVYAYRLRRMWEEYSVTGRSWKTSNLWSTVGALNTTYDIYATVAGSAVWKKYQWNTMWFTASEFEALRTSNTGFLFRQVAGGQGDHQFYSRESGSGPTFTVNYTLPASFSITNIGECSYTGGESLTPVTFALTGASITFTSATWGSMGPYTTGQTINLKDGYWTYSWTATSGYTGSGSGNFTLEDCVKGSQQILFI